MYWLHRFRGISSPLFFARVVHARRIGRHGWTMPASLATAIRADGARICANPLVADVLSFRRARDSLPRGRRLIAFSSFLELLESETLSDATGTAAFPHVVRLLKAAGIVLWGLPLSSAVFAKCQFTGCPHFILVCAAVKGGGASS